MSDEEVMELQNSGHIEFGGHTLTHVSFFDVDDERAREEIVKDKEITEKRLGKKLKVCGFRWSDTESFSCCCTISFSELIFIIL